MTRARVALKTKVKSAQKNIEQQRLLAEANKQRRGKRFQGEWDMAKEKARLTSIVHAEDPDWAGPTSLYASTTQLLEKGLDTQVLSCRVGGPGQLRQILCEEGHPVNPERLYVFSQVDPFIGRQYT